MWSLEHYNLLQNVLSKKFRIEECNKDDFDISKFLIIPIKDSSGIKFKHPCKSFRVLVNLDRLYISVNKLSLNSTFNSEDNSYAVGGKIGLTEFSFSELVKLIHEKIDSEIKSKKKVVLFYDQDTQKFKDWLDNIDEIDLNAFQFEHIEFTDSKVTQPYICDKVLLIFNHLGKIDTDRFKRALTLKDKYKGKFPYDVLIFRKIQDDCPEAKRYDLAKSGFAPL